MEMKESDIIEMRKELCRINREFERLSTDTAKVFEYMSRNLECKEELNETYSTVKNAYYKLITEAEQFISGDDEIDENDFEDNSMIFVNNFLIHKYNVCKKLTEISIREANQKYKVDNKKSLPQFK